ncbi:homeobox protein CDX-1b [Epinephelus lanceolatus]|uniref:homeobox protein CDX-1b n=1 Tax=Epinephelus lanceolatus TaxID=310571 RepID=UPI001446B367|nr:homeobox protein CDX-1b [Epinephelus lanceolatus]XP_033495510.1 homeobox protein CDX-1b [Epinephelus lanceolatus]
MYVSYLQLDKDPAMYPHQTPVTRHPGLSPQNFSVPAPPQYSDFSAYHHHHHHGINNDPHPSQQPGPGPGGWSSAYPPPPPPARDDWSSHHYAAAAAAAAAGGTSAASTVPGVVGPPLGFSPPEFPGQPSALLPAALNASAGQLSPGSPQRRNPYDWIRRSSAPPTNPNGKTRTKDKYRVVYTDHQRLELEKEFHYSKYITIRRKAELATSLGLSERQVKIWFQNRRAKERKINKKKLQQPASSTTTPTPPTGSNSSGGGGGGGGLHGNGGNSVGMVTSSSGSNGLVSPSSLPLNIKEEY